MLTFIHLGAMQAFLKFAFGVGVVGFSSSMLIDAKQSGALDRHMKFIKKIGGRNVKKVKAIPIGEKEHVTVLGLTQHGKTYATMETLKSLKEGVLFFNVQQEITPNNFIKASNTNTWSQIKGLLKEGKKVNYIPDTDLESASKELGALINELYNSGQLKCRIAIDECHLFSSLTKDKSGIKACIRLATTGLRFGYQTIFLSQRPAKVDNTLYSQSTKHVLFALGKVDESYLKNHGFPVEEIVSKTENDYYNFVVFNQKEVSEVMRIG